MQAFIAGYCEIWYYNYNFSYHLGETTLKQQQKRENLKTCSLLKIIIKL